MVQTIFGSTVVILKHADVKTLFPDKIYEEMFDYLMKPRNKFVDHPYAKGGKICTTDLNLAINEDKIDQLQPLLNFLKQIGLKYSYLFSDKTIKDLIFDNTWMNLTFEGCEIKNHYDKYQDTVSKSLIILFYPKTPLGGSNLVFIHNSKYGQWVSECSETDLVRIEIEEGNIIIFDNSILHAIDAHRSSEPRMCIATEFKLETDQ
jgi:hypothetical protein